jgi:DNA-binding winged helix-turn-helix (wHTH) protein
MHPVLHENGSVAAEGRLTTAASLACRRFGPFALDPAAAVLSRDGRRIELRPCAFHLLSYLVEHAGRVVRRDELFEQVWRGVFVGDGVLTQSIWEVRKALGEAGRQQRFIRTARGSGYRFTADVLCDASPEQAGGPISTMPLVAAYDDIIASARLLGAIELEVQARLDRAACLLAGARGRDDAARVAEATMQRLRAALAEARASRSARPTPEA